MPSYLCGAGILAIPRETSVQDIQPEIRISIESAFSEEEFIARTKKEARKIFPKKSWRIKILFQKFDVEEVKAIYKERQEKIFFFAFLLMPGNPKKPPDIVCCFVYEPTFEKAEQTAKDSFLYGLSSFESTVSIHSKEVPKETIEKILSPHLH